MQYKIDGYPLKPDQRTDVAVYRGFQILSVGTLATGQGFMPCVWISNPELSPIIGAEPPPMETVSFICPQPGQPYELDGSEFYLGCVQFAPMAEQPNMVAIVHVYEVHPKAEADGKTPIPVDGKKHKPKHKGPESKEITGESASAISLILQERKKQEDKGYNSESDDKWKDGELRVAAEYYVKVATGGMDTDRLAEYDSLACHCGHSDYGSVKRNLAVAGALFMAEQDRLNRQGKFAVGVNKGLDACGEMLQICIENGGELPLNPMSANQKVGTMDAVAHGDQFLYVFTRYDNNGKMQLQEQASGIGVSIEEGERNAREHFEKESGNDESFITYRLDSKTPYTPHAGGVIDAMQGQPPLSQLGKEAEERHAKPRNESEPDGRRLYGH